MTNEELQIVIREAVGSAVKETLTTLGIDASDPIKTQEQMSALRDIAKMLDDEEFKKDLAHVRKWRQSVDKVSDVSVRTAIGILVTGFFGLILFAVKTWLENPK